MHLSDYMAENGLSDDDVAAAIGKSRPSVSRYRRKLMRPDWAGVEKIRTFTGGIVTADDWLGVPEVAEAAE